MGFLTILGGLGCLFALIMLLPLYQKPRLATILFWTLIFWISLVQFREGILNWCGFPEIPRDQHWQMFQSLLGVSRIGAPAGLLDGYWPPPLLVILYFLFCLICWRCFVNLPDGNPTFDPLFPEKR